MAGPTELRIKRRRDEVAPDSLVVQQETEETEDRQSKRARGSGQRPVHYIRQKSTREEESQTLHSTTSTAQHTDSASLAQDVKSKGANGVSGSGMNGPTSQNKERRIFHLRRPGTTETGVRKRRSKEDGIATFVERRAKRKPQELLDLADHSRSTVEAASASAPKLLKRPGKGSAVKTPPDLSSSSNAPPNGSSTPNDRHLQAMANSLQQFALEEAEKEEVAAAKPKLLSKPKLPAQRSRELHRQRASQAPIKAPEQQADIDMDVDEEADYVYETYILAPTSDIGTAQIDAQDALGDVGYLIITEEDQAIWESYIEDEPSDKEWDTDEDDENAEDWYGADYPDDELASDDEFDRNAYGYRGHRGSDAEEWDEDTGAFSDDEYERQMNPFGSKKTPKQFAKYFNGVQLEDDEE